MLCCTERWQDCYVQGYQEQAVLGRNCGPGCCSLTELEYRLVQLRCMEEDNNARLLDAVLGRTVGTPACCAPQQLTAGVHCR